MVPEQTLTLGRDRIIPVHVEGVSSEPRDFETTSSDETVLKIVTPARVLAGQTTGYIVVRPVVEGKTTIRIAQASLDVAVATRPSVVLEAFDRPTIEGPSNGAAIWGKVSVGVSYWDIAPQGQAAAAAHPEQGAWLLVQGMEPLRPVRMTSPDDGPLVHACFEFDAAELPEGPVRLIARTVEADGTEHKSLPTVVRVLRAESSMLAAGECEDDYGVDEPNPYERRQQPSRNAVQRDARASGGRYFGNAGTFPRFGFPVEVESAGWYQLAIVAAADMAMGTLPSVGIIINPASGMDTTPVTSGPVLSQGWHRLSLGVPFRLEAGKQIVRLHFMNDFYAGGGSDRNLRLDRWELLRVADAKGDAGTTAGGGMMSMQAMSASAGGMASGAMSGGDDAMASMMGGGESAADSSGAWPASVAAMNASGEGPLRIAFSEVLDGRSVPGEIEIRGAVWQRAGGAADRGGTGAAAPRVVLLIDGREVASQYSYSPRFRLRPDQLRAGTNFVSLAAVSESGMTARTPEQRLRWQDSEAAGVGRGVNAYHRFTVHDPAWSENTRTLRSTEKQPEDRISAGMASNTTLALTLPDELEGEFALEAEAMGQNFDGPAVLEFAIVTGEAAKAAFDPAQRPSPRLGRQQEEDGDPGGAEQLGHEEAVRERRPARDADHAREDGRQEEQGQGRTQLRHRWPRGPRRERPRRCVPRDRRARDVRRSPVRRGRAPTPSGLRPRSRGSRAGG